ncbi:MAG: SpoIIE family protein phosphatase [Acidobacteriia bacterium]|nr:SpoIIE family protein phosphatase [Terriglobia bacterium]
MKRTLQIRTADGGRQTVPLDGDKLALGRAHENELHFPDDTSLSRRHLLLERTGDDWTVRDLGSKNGTFVNGERLSESHRLTPGDRIAAGHLTLAFEDPLGAAAGDVTFFAGSEADLPPNATIISNLEGALSGESTPTQSGKLQAAVRTTGPKTPFDDAAVTALIRAGRELAIRRPLPELFHLILDLSVETVKADRGVLLTLEKEGLLARAARGEGFRISTAVRDRVLHSRQSLLVRDTSLDEALRNRVSISEQNVRTLMAVPLQTGDRVIGLIYVDFPALAADLAPRDLDLLTVLANVAAIRIEQERLALVELDEHRHALELEQAAEIQRRLLPNDAPAVEGADLAGFNTSCRTVGGDYYDFFPLTDGRVAVVLADVSGKGLPASLLMASLQARVQVLLEEPDDLPRLMSRLDRMMSKSCPGNRFVTMFLCVLDPRTGEMAYCNAGHNPPLLARAEGQVEQLRGGGTVLGMFPDLGYEEKRCRMEPGDLLTLFSDGVTEASSPADEEFGEERLARLLAGARGISAEAVLDLIGKTLAEWTAGAPPTDDITVVAIRRC